MPACSAAGPSERTALTQHCGELVERTQVHPLGKQGERRQPDSRRLEPGQLIGLKLDAVRMLDNEIWGQGFPAPLFDDVFRVERQRLLKDRHLKLELSRNATRFDAIRFNHADGAADQIRAAYRLAINEYNGIASVQLMVEHFEAA